MINKNKFLQFKQFFDAITKFVKDKLTDDQYKEIVKYLDGVAVLFIWETNDKNLPMLSLIASNDEYYDNVEFYKQLLNKLFKIQQDLFNDIFNQYEVTIINLQKEILAKRSDFYDDSQKGQKGSAQKE
ncbi:MAG: hypothetical protein QXV52_06820 [Nitrososphaeria archaeon]